MHRRPGAKSRGRPERDLFADSFVSPTVKVPSRGRTVYALRAGMARITTAAARRTPPKLRRHILFLSAHRRLGRFSRPVTFNEKLNWRMLYDHRELIALTCDKLAAKQYAQEHSVRVPLTLWSGSDLRELETVPMPERWVLKPNHSSGQVHFGSGPLRRGDPLFVKVRSWLQESAPARNGEWGYQRARRLLLVEERIGSRETTPTSFKVYAFDGQPRMIGVISVEPDRFSRWQQTTDTLWPPAGTARRFYTPDWQPLSVTEGGLPLASVVPPPPNLGAILETASQLAQPFDFIRVDLYTIGEAVYFGELTAYPGAGLSRFHPYRVDRQLGALWRLPRF